ncbi:MAG: type II toxin-antitoxin system YafQ family toxin [Syntrophomonadaceae bacterium]|jgi:mRNA interferase YafQ|nr:type II toxin-antitoxin system YafQ family toxin [Syntrophomonadaceae bacterium]
MYEVKPSSKFKKDLKQAAKRGYNIPLLTTVIKLLANTGTLPAMYKDHALSGNWAGHRECHITPDWLLIYKIEKDILILTLTRTGSHSDLLE